MPEGTEPHDPIALTRSAFACADARDIASLMKFVSPDSVWDVSAWGFGIYEGRRAIRRFLEDWIGSFEEYGRDSEEMLDLGNGVVYAVAVTRGRSAGSRHEVGLRGATVCLWDGAVATRVSYYRDRDEARAAAERLAASRGQARAP